MFSVAFLNPDEYFDAPIEKIDELVTPPIPRFLWLINEADKKVKKSTLSSLADQRKSNLYLDSTLTCRLIERFIGLDVELEFKVAPTSRNEEHDGSSILKVNLIKSHMRLIFDPGGLLVINKFSHLAGCGKSFDYTIVVVELELSLDEFSYVGHDSHGVGIVVFDLGGDIEGNMLEKLTVGYALNYCISSVDKCKLLKLLNMKDGLICDFLTEKVRSLVRTVAITLTDLVPRRVDCLTIGESMWSSCESSRYDFRFPKLAASFGYAAEVSFCLLEELLSAEIAWAAAAHGHQEGSLMLLVFDPGGEGFMFVDDSFRMEFLIQDKCSRYIDEVLLEMINEFEKLIASKENWMMDARKFQPASTRGSKANGVSYKLSFVVTHLIQKLVFVGVFIVAVVDKHKESKFVIIIFDPGGHLELSRSWLYVIGLMKENGHSRVFLLVLPLCSLHHLALKILNLEDKVLLSKGEVLQGYGSWTRFTIICHLTRFVPVQYFISLYVIVQLFEPN